MATIRHNKKGFGVEDAPFMILAAVAVMMLVVWIGVSAMAQFVSGNERQAAVEAAADIYARARLVSLGYEGSSDRISVSLPRGYAIRVDGGIAAFGGATNGSLENATQLTEQISIQGVEMEAEGGIMPEGQHNVLMLYENGKVKVSWD
jgi:hypothetical protein